MATTFVALQCYQCSTMQVKQQRKSGNKWRCAVCNESQSVRRVFARGFMAKDLRGFVQSFNMSRADPDRGADLSSAFGEEHCEDGRELRRKPRVDWSQYLDSEEKEEEGNPPGHEGDDTGPKIVTELPSELFKKPKLSKGDSAPGCRQYAGADGYGGGCGNRKELAPGSERSGYKLTKAGVSSHSCGTNYPYPPGTLGRDEPEAARTTLLAKISKWQEYLTGETDGDDLEPASGRKSVAMCEWNSSSWEANVDDQKVEDDVHPDFK